tara:strand:+ start:7602 stop:8654 length:1053 start_codon:yes stop_codon:yes gene_type:complete
MIYKEFNIQPPNSPESGDVITNVKDIVSSGMWADGAASITTFFTSSVQSGSNAAHYLDVFSANPQSDSSAKVQFSIAYGHFHGSGSVGGTGLAGNRASAGIYRQLSQTLLGPNEDKFTFAGTGAHITPNYVYAISVARQQLREKMDPGNWELHISGSNNKGIMKLIDDSGATTEAKVNQGGRVFNVVSGSIQGGTADIDTTAANQPGGGLGLFYPDLGIIILNGPVLASPMSASLSASLASNTEGGNVGKFFEKIEAANYFAARREEIITSQHFFCRIPNKEFNFSSNPSFATSSDGSFTQSTFFKNPKTFITQVGLYNDGGELLAVAKLSKPLLKSYSREAIVKVKLDF